MSVSGMARKPRSLESTPYSSEGEKARYWLTPPSRAIFILSVFLALLALLVRYAHIHIPVVSTYTFETLLVAACRVSVAARG